MILDDLESRLKELTKTDNFTQDIQDTDEDTSDNESENSEEKVEEEEQVEEAITVTKGGYELPSFMELMWILVLFLVYTCENENKYITNNKTFQILN